MDRGLHARPSEVFGLVARVRTVRRAGDATRVVLALFACLGLIVLSRVGNAVRAQDEVSGSYPLITLPTPPTDVQWLVNAVRVSGTLGVAAIVLLVAIAGRRARMLLDVSISVLVTLVVVYLVQQSMGAYLSRLHLGSQSLAVVPPVVAIALAVASAGAGGPFLGRASRRLVYGLVAAGAVATAFHEGTGLLGVLAGIVVGWGVVAAVHLALGSPTGFPSAERAALDARELGFEVGDVEALDDQDWSVARFTACSANGEGAPVSLIVYGRDAADAQLLSRIWRFLWYRDVGRSLGYSRMQLVEHQAFVTMLAERSGVSVPKVLSAGYVSSTEDALLIETVPEGSRVSALDGDQLSDATLRELWESVRRLHSANIAHGALDGDHLFVTVDGVVAIRDLRSATVSATEELISRDIAEALVATALIVGPERAVAGATDVLGAARLERALPFLQPAALGSATRQALRHQRHFLGELRVAASRAAGVDEPELVELHRIKWTTVVFAAMSLFGFWLIVGQITSAGDLAATLSTANWWWVVLIVLLSLLPAVGTAYALTGSVSEPLPFGSVVILYYGLAFMGLIGSTLATTATIIRFFQRRGLAASIAVSSGVLVGFSNFVVQFIVVLVCLPFVSSARTPALSRSSSSGDSGSAVLWVVLLAVVVVGVVVGVLVARPLFRRNVIDKVKPQATSMLDNLRRLAREPRRIARLLVGNAGAQIVYALALGAALAAYGQSISFAALLLVNTAASLLGGLAPVPGGMGVTEATLIAGLSSFGVPQPEAVAAALTYRLFTAYLAPVWGYPSLYWLRKKEYL
ncbi:MAG: flippase-like domain-containing protein [Actinobacteria bacterium]|nr:flippase-like domain-containing protein [Actinomycetota bacterium]